MSRPRSANPTESRWKRSAADPHEATVSAVTAVGLATERHSITGRPVVITGAASGIGRALATRLSRLGSPVVLARVTPTHYNAVLTRVMRRRRTEAA
jgi:NADPH:quinone reductase-like Zn-dependent oxidoreductase